MEFTGKYSTRISRNDEIKVKVVLLSLLSRGMLGFDCMLRGRAWGASVGFDLGPIDYGPIWKNTKNMHGGQLRSLFANHKIERGTLSRLIARRMKHESPKVRSAEPTAASSVFAKTTSIYPKPYDATVQGRSKRALGNHFGLTNFGVNHTTLEAGAASALQHSHLKQDELVYILSGTATLLLGDKEFVMKEGDTMGFRAGNGESHCIVNRSSTPVVFLEIGDRTQGDAVTYPDADLQAVDKDGTWNFLHKDGTPYEKTD